MPISIELQDFLNQKVKEYNQQSFIAADPISIPHRFSKKQDIEIAGFFAAIFAWGNRTTIINKCNELMMLMDNAPYQFITQHAEMELKRFLAFKHRTFNATDLLHFIRVLRYHYENDSSAEPTLEKAFSKGLNPKDFEAYIDSFRYGAPPHSGFGLGLERIVMLILGIQNIREVTLFPRDRDRLTP